MRAAQNLRKAALILVCAFIGIIIGLAAPPGPKDATPQPAPTTPLVAIDGHDAARFAAPSPSTLGWRWKGTVNVYDGTNDPAWKVSEAAQEWGARTGLHMQMVGTLAAAQIVVYEVDQFTTTNAPANALGVAYWPHLVGDVADGQCRIELISWLPGVYPRTAEHDALHELGHCLGLAHNTTDRRAVMAPSVQLGEGYTKPQAADVKNLRTLYP